MENIRTDDDVEDKFKMPSKFCIFGVKRRVRNVNKNRKNKSSLQRISHNSSRTSNNTIQERKDKTEVWYS